MRFRGLSIGFLLAPIATVCWAAPPVSGRLIFTSDFIYGLYEMDANGANIFSILPYNNLDFNANVFELTQARNSSKIAFLARHDSGDQARIFVMDGDGTGIRQITFHDSTSFPRSHNAPAISPDGTKVAFVDNEAFGTGLSGTISGSCATTNFGALDIVNVDGSGLHQIVGPVQSDTRYCNLGNVLEAAWNPDGSKLVFRENGIGGTPACGTGIFIVNADGGGLQLLACDNNSSQAVKGLDWSPDGSRIVALVNGGQNWSQYSGQGSFLNSIPTPPGTAQAGVIRYSPDSTQLAYVSNATNTNDYFVTTDLNGNSIQTVDVRKLYGLVPDMGLSFWWAAGAAIGAPATMTLTPSVINVCPNAPVQFLPSTFNSTGAMLTHGWSTAVFHPVSGDGGSLYVDGFGSVNFKPGRSAGTFTMQVFQSIGNNVTSNSINVNTQPDCSLFNPSLSIAKSHAGNFVAGQTNAAYTVTVSNAANVNATSGTVTVTETVPAGLTLVSMSGSGWTCSSNTCTRSDTLASGTSYPSITVKVNVGSGATSPQVNSVSVSGGGSASASISDSAIITTPTLSLNRTTLNFAIGVNGTASDPQTVTVTFTGGAAIPWSATSNQPNVVVTPGSGTGNGSFQVSASSGPNAIVAVTAPNAGGSPKQIQVNISNPSAGNPFGSFDTPADNTPGVAGAIPVTGWALDNVEVTKVDIWREPVGSEPAGALIYIGDAVFVVGARPDVEALYPKFPFNYRAGWGYQMLTNFLPNGNGTFKLHAIAHNKAGSSFDLGTKTIVVDNAHASKPFGTLDTPSQGGNASGNAFVNFGWALTQNPNKIPIDGSTISVVIDGQVVGHPTYNQFRSDIASLFPGYLNSGGAVGFFYIDTTALAAGVHTISWNVFDNAGHGDGIGSRYFNVFNSGNAPAAPDSPIFASTSTVTLRRAFGRGAEPVSISPDDRGAYSVEIEEVGGIELNAGVTDGHMLVNGEARDLPVGSSIKDGVFYWQPGPGFLGDYQLVLLRPGGEEVQVRVKIRPKTFGRRPPTL